MAKRPRFVMLKSVKRHTFENERPERNVVVLSNEVLPCGAFGNSRVFELLDRFRNGGFIYEIIISELLQNSGAGLIRNIYRLPAPILR